MTNENNPTADVKRQLWRVQLDKQLVERVDDMKWEFRTSRIKLMQRMIKLSLLLMEPVPGGMTQFEQLEREIESQATATNV